MKALILSSSLFGSLGVLGFLALGGPVGSGANAQGAGTVLASAETAEPDRTVVDPVVDYQVMVDLVSGRSNGQIDRAIRRVRASWDPALVPQLIEAALYARSPYASQQIFELLERRTRQRFGADAQRWFQWQWNQPERLTADYANFKAYLYSGIDERFGPYFQDRLDTARIRLDEVRWGGVQQDGIPPLRAPDMIDAADADYLDDDNIVFGIAINGDVRAYPKRILAWHEMFVDQVGGVDVAGVYCTLCGTVIPYKTTVDGVKHEMGTSGFLYRSNKLMYDKATQSLWNTLTGEPVIGPLVDQGIKFEYFPVVTTTWGAWKARHPGTKVLSLRTGHRRDYGEGVAYRDYFATDDLMFRTPFEDDRLENKQEILALRFAGAPDDQLAIDTDFLMRNPIYSGRIGLQPFVVLTDATGANRVYAPGEVTFTDYDRGSGLTGSDGSTWALTEDALVAEDGRRLARLPAHRAFWFGWRAAFPETQLIK